MPVSWNLSWYLCRLIMILILVKTESEYILNSIQLYENPQFFKIWEYFGKKSILNLLSKIIWRYIFAATGSFSSLCLFFPFFPCCAIDSGLANDAVVLAKLPDLHIFRRKIPRLCLSKVAFLSSFGSFLESIIGKHNKLSSKASPFAWCTFTKFKALSNKK